MKPVLFRNKSQCNNACCHLCSLVTISENAALAPLRQRTDVGTCMWTIFLRVVRILYLEYDVPFNAVPFEMYMR
jgi:hypothetical protein